MEMCAGVKLLYVGTDEKQKSSWPFVASLVRK